MNRTKQRGLFSRPLPTNYSTEALELEKDTRMVPLEQDRNRAIEQDVEDANQIVNMERDRSLADDALDAIDSLEAFRQELIRSSDKGGMSPEAARYFALGYHTVIKKFPDFDRASVSSLEGIHDPSSTYQSTSMLIRDLEVSVEGMLDYARKKFKEVWDALVNLFSSKKNQIYTLKKKLQHIEISDHSGSDKKVVFPKANRFKVKGKFNPHLVLKNLDLLYELEVLKEGYLEPFEKGVDAVVKTAEKFKSGNLPDNTEEVLKKEIDRAVGVSYNTKLWDRVNSKDKPTIQYKASDAISITKTLPSTEHGLLGDGYKYVNTADDRDSTEEVEVADRMFIKELNKAADKLIETYEKAERDLEQLKYKVQQIIEDANDLLKVGKGRTFLTGIFSCLTLLSGITLVILGNTLQGVTAGAYTVAAPVAKSVTYLGGTVGGAIGGASGSLAGAFAGGAILGLPGIMLAGFVTLAGVMGLNVGGKAEDLGRASLSKQKEIENRAEIDQQAIDNNREQIIEEIRKGSERMMPKLESDVANFSKSIVTDLMEPYRTTLHDLTRYCVLSYMKRQNDNIDASDNSDEIKAAAKEGLQGDISHYDDLKDD